MAKGTIEFKKPAKKPTTASTDDWVASRGDPSEKLKRFTIDVSASLHTRIKMDCAENGMKMSDVIREMLEQRFPVK